MGRAVYLLSMNLSGIKSIEDEICISFYGKRVSKDFDPDKNRLKVIYGENGSGKTAIITAVDIVNELIINENYLRSPQTQSLLNELINKNARKFVFKCEFVTFIESFMIYEYEVDLSFDENEEVYVSYESLKYKRNDSKNTPKVAFVCDKGELVDINVSPNEKNVIIDGTKNLLTKQSALLLILKEIVKKKLIKKDNDIFLYPVVFFVSIFTYFNREDQHIDYYQRLRLNELKQNKLPIESILEEISKSIPANERRVHKNAFNDYLKKIRGLEKFIKIFKPSLKCIDVEKIDDREFYNCRIIMNYGTYSVDREFESTGIKHLVEMYDALKAASFGAIVFIDEMDSNINSVYLCKIIEYIKLYCDGQVLFTSQNLGPMSVIKDNNKSIDFLTTDNRIVSWVKNGHYSPDNTYRNGMIEGLPFNVDPSDFISVFGGKE